MMPERARVRKLMTEIGPAMDLGEVHELEEDNLWTMVEHDGVALFVEYDPDDHRLWLSAEVGATPPGNRQRLYALMLQYNAHWQETGGVRLALDGSDGAVVQAYDLSAVGLDLHRLQNVVRNFRDTLEAWQQIVATDLAASGLGGTDDLGPLTLHGMIRG